MGDRRSPGTRLAGAFMVDWDRSPGRQVNGVGCQEGRPYNSKADQEWVMAPSEARGQTAVPITSRCGSKLLRDLEYRSHKPFLITNYLILVAVAFSVGA